MNNESKSRIQRKRATLIIKVKLENIHNKNNYKHRRPTIKTTPIISYNKFQSSKVSIFTSTTYFSASIYSRGDLHTRVQYLHLDQGILEGCLDDFGAQVDKNFEFLLQPRKIIFIGPQLSGTYFFFHLQGSLHHSHLGRLRSKSSSDICQIFIHLWTPPPQSDKTGPP